MAMNDVARCIANPRVDRTTGLEDFRSWIGEKIFSTADCEAAKRTIAHWPGYAPTPLRRFGAIAASAGVAEVYYKDEAGRFGLKSFKALGGAYAVLTLFADEVKRRTGRRVEAAELMSDRYREIARSFVVASATAGNHGRSVAWGAAMLGCPCFIYIHKGVGEARAEAIASYGAKVVRVEGDYDDSVRAAADAARVNGWTIVSDTSYDGYTEIPRRVMCGYSVMLDEIFEQCGDKPPTHILVPAGVGGLAAAVAACAGLNAGPRRAKLVVVEPTKADCLFQSVLHGRPTKAAGPLGSIMLGLDCAEVSLIAWDVLDRLADAFALITDEAAIAAMRELNHRTAGGDDVVAGECAGAGLGFLRAVQSDLALRSALGLDAASRVLLFGTEGDTDPSAHRRLLGAADAEQAACA